MKQDSNKFSRFRGTFHNKAYWSHNQITLFTVCVWESNGMHTMVIVSDSLHHDTFAVNVFLSEIFEYLDENVQHFESIDDIDTVQCAQINSH